MKRQYSRMIASMCLALLLSMGMVIAASAGGSEAACRSNCSSTGGFIAGGEVAFLKPHYGSMSASIPGEPAELLLPGFDMDASPRVWLGYQSADGVTVRGRYWYFEHSTSGGAVDAEMGLKAQTADIEIGQVGCFWGWECEATGGVRWGQICSDKRVDFDGDEFVLGSRFEGVGPTVAFATRRPIGCRGLAMVGSMRASLLYGDANFTLGGDVIEEFFDAPGDLTADFGDDLAQVYEIRIGAEWSRVSKRGTVLTARAVLEAQSWEIQHLGFIGPAISLGIER